MYKKVVVVRFDIKNTSLNILKIRSLWGFFVLVGKTGYEWFGTKTKTTPPKIEGGDTFTKEVDGGKSLVLSYQ